MAARSKSGDGASLPEHPVGGPRERAFLIAASPSLRVGRHDAAHQDTLVPFGAPPVDLDVLLEQLTADPTVTVERVLGEGLRKVIVARMPEETAIALARHPQVLVEEDAAIHPVPALSGPAGGTPVDPGAVLSFGPTTTWQFRVLGADDEPVAGAAVLLYGTGIPTQGRTDSAGSVSLRLLNATDHTVRALYVNPPSGHWDLWLDDPRVDAGSLNVVRLEPLGHAIAGFPATQLVGWGQRAMRLDQLDPGATGAGVKVAVIDSGVEPAHPDLARVVSGRDVTVDPPSDEGWADDLLGHGSHCAGIIAGSSEGGGIRGFAPAAEVIAIRVFPGGRFSTLLDALDHCIAEQVDVVNLSIGSAGASGLVLAKLAQAKAAGVACVVAAGNTGGPVQFPGTSFDVLTVAAVGRLGEFPATSRHARQLRADVDAGSGYFSARFSAYGPEVDVCAPGVAIVSSVPPDGFAAWDGTSMAAAHVTGLAALVLAHHPDLTERFRPRDAARVERLFEILRASATPLAFGDPGRSGAGVPDAVRALSRGLATARPGVAAPQTGSPWAVIEGLRRGFVTAGLLPA